MLESGSQISIALVGGGKIARDQHLPTLTRSTDFKLQAAITLPDSPIPGLPNFPTITAMRAALPHVSAVALCTPPRPRCLLAMEAFAAGLDVLNEKPPAATLREAEDMTEAAAKEGRVLYQSWHSREAAAVEPAIDWLKGKEIRRVNVTWKEDARVWHPLQDWIWQPGIGVFDPGINALSIVSHILAPLTLADAELRFPANKAAPVAADLLFDAGYPVTVALDFDQQGPQTWDIEFETSENLLKLSDGGGRLLLDGSQIELPAEPEYDRVYRRFAALLRHRASDADFTPFRLVADAFSRGRRVTVQPFIE